MSARTKVKERGILFKGRLVRALLNESKTQTRRPLRKQPPKSFMHGDVAAITNGTSWAISRSILHPQGRGAWPPGREPGIKSPFGVEGDVLYVRETWRPVEPETTSGIEFRADGKFVPISNTREAANQWLAVRRSSEQHPENAYVQWRPSIHMPRWASRINLRVKRVWVERCSEITSEDCKAEGAEVYPEHRGDGWRYRSVFQASWETIYPGTWKAGVWVWCCEFEREEPS